MAAIDDLVAFHWPRGDGHSGVTDYAAQLAALDVDVVMLQAGELLGVIIETAGGKDFGDSADLVIALARSALALLGNAGPAVDTLDRYCHSRSSDAKPSA